MLGNFFKRSNFLKLLIRYARCLVIDNTFHEQVELNGKVFTIFAITNEKLIKTYK